MQVLRSGKKALIVKRGGEIQVFGETCPHMGADMTEAVYCAEKGTLQCRWHGYIFSSKGGGFLENPNEVFMRLLREPTEHFKPEKMPKYRLPVVAHSVRDGRLYLGKPADKDAKEEASAKADGGAGQ